MKKLFIGLCCALCGCARNNPPPYYPLPPVRNEPPRQERPQTESARNVPQEKAAAEKTSPRMIRSEKCENLPAIQIFKVTNSFSLARACKTVPENAELYCQSHIVYIAREEGRLHYDGQHIKPNKGKCFSYDGAYRYVDIDGETHSVPKIEIIDSMIEEFDPDSYFLERTRR